ARLPPPSGRATGVTVSVGPAAGLGTRGGRGVGTAVALEPAPPGGCWRGVAVGRGGRARGGRRGLSGAGSAESSSAVSAGAAVGCAVGVAVPRGEPPRRPRLLAGRWGDSVLLSASAVGVVGGSVGSRLG